MKIFHIIAGLLALLAGAVALFASKGSTLHRRSGIAFVASMLAMTASALLMAVFVRPNRLNVVAALVTAYLVASAWLVVRHPLARSRKATLALLAMAMLTSLFALGLAVQAGRSPDGRIDGMPPQPLVAFALVAGLAAIGDVRLLRAGQIGGAGRLLRHLWRMCVAMLIATASFFLGQAKVFPTPLRKSGLLVVPVLLVLAVLVYWLVRVRKLGRRKAVLPGTISTQGAAVDAATPRGDP